MHGLSSNYTVQPQIYTTVPPLLWSHISIVPWTISWSNYTVLLVILQACCPTVHLLRTCTLLYACTCSGQSISMLYNHNSRFNMLYCSLKILRSSQWANSQISHLLSCCPLCSLSLQTARFVFQDNRAFISGDNIYAFSLRGCRVSNFVPREIADFLLIGSDKAVQYNFTDEGVLGSTATGPVYLFFYGASTKCYKPVGNVTYLLPNCSNSLLSRK